MFLIHYIPYIYTLKHNNQKSNKLFTVSTGLEILSIIPYNVSKPNFKTFISYVIGYNI